jgi:hypothetical protein
VLLAFKNMRMEGGGARLGFIAYTLFFGSEINMDAFHY